MLSVLSPLLYGPMSVLSAGVRGIYSVGGNLFFGKKSNVHESITNSTSNNTSTSTSNGVSNNSNNVGEVEVSLADTCDAATHIDGTCSLTSPSLIPAVVDIENIEHLPDDPDMVVLGSINNSKLDRKWTWGKKSDKKKPDRVRISESDWSHMTPYIEPRHLSIHSAQISEVRRQEKYLLEEWERI